jgi:hypothetical protein
MLANCSTADSASLPEITHDIGTKKVSIKDNGPGILKEHFVLGKSRGEGHSNHGIGLKDAIVVLRREYQATITIRTREFLYTFTDARGSLGDETLHLVVDKVDLEIIQGTQIDIEYNAPSPDAVSKDFVKAKEYFLEHFKANLILLATDEHLEMYIPTEGANSSKIFNFIFVSGVKKQTARQFRCVYNVKGRLADKVKNMVDRDHHISNKKRFDKEIFPKIQQFAFETVVSKTQYLYLMFPDETGHNNVVPSATCEFYRPSKPTTPPLRDVTASPVSTINSDFDAQQPIVTLPLVPRPTEEIELSPMFHRSLATEVFAFLDDQQNSTMINLSPGERKRVATVSDAVKEALRQIFGRSISHIGSSGSIAKNTAVSHSVDVDMVVFFKEFQSTRALDYARIIKRDLESLGCRFLSSADDILKCVYGSVTIDIVLTSAADIDHPRYREFQSGPEAVTYFTESIRDNAWIAEVVRAAKYWVMRCNDNEDLRVKSLAVELVVLEVFKACEEQCAYRSTKDNRKALFLAFLQFLTRPSDDQRIPHQQEKEDVFEEIKKPLWRYQRLAEAALQDLQ